MTLNLSLIFLAALASLALGGMRRAPPKPAKQETVKASPRPAAKLSPLTKALVDRAKHGPVPLPIEGEMRAAYGGDDIPLESVEFPARRQYGKIDDAIPF